MPRTGALRIAMIGQKGLPATWGGVEHHVEAIGSRLAARGHEVVVYCRPNYTGERTAREYRGMRLVPVRTIETKHLDAISHSAASTVKALRAGTDVLHYHAIGPGLVAPVPRYLSRSHVVLTVHGLDGERAKWGGGAQSVLRFAEELSARVPDETVVVSKALQDHYADRWSRSTTWIPNGVDRPAPADPTPLARMGLEPGRYALFVGRFVPEKDPELLVRAFAGVPGDVRLVMAGGSSFSDSYEERVTAVAREDSRVVMPGYVFGPDLAALYAHAGAFVLPSLVEGLPLTLLEAASHGTPVVASAIPPHVEVLRSSGPGRRLVPPGDEGALRQALTAALADVDGERRGAAVLRDEVLDRYRWDRAVEQLEEVYHRVTGRLPSLS